MSRAGCRGAGPRRAGGRWVLAERAVADPPAAESSRHCHQLQQQVDAAATVIAALCANNTALREQLAARTAPGAFSAQGLQVVR